MNKPMDVSLTDLVGAQDARRPDHAVPAVSGLVAGEPGDFPVELIEQFGQQERGRYLVHRHIAAERGGLRASLPGTTVGLLLWSVAAACRFAGCPRVSQTARAGWGLLPRREATFGPAAACGVGRSLAGILARKV